MSHFEHLLQDLFGRHQHGLPVYTIKIKPQELSALRDSLWAAVSEHRMSVLLKRPLLVRCFVIYAAEFLVQKGQVLRWRPILESIGISGDEAARYPDLYDPIVDALRSFGRNVIKRHGARRFLATLLREGGLPIQIGNLPELIGKIAREIGWEALAGPEAMAARKFAVVRIQAAAQEPLRGVLEATEATEALEELLADAADARAALVHKGVDPTKLSTAADVRDALKAHGIALPGARDENLVSAILGSFREQPRAPSEEFAPPPRAFVEITAADTLNQRIELRLRLDLTTPALRARVPASVSHVAVSLEPGARDSRLLLWSNDTKRFEVDGQRSDCVEWRYSADGSPITIAARYMDESGAAELLTLETIDPQDEPISWFDAEGRPLHGTRETLRVGERLLLVAHEGVELEVTGGVRAQSRTPPAGAAQAWVIEGASEGTARVSGVHGDLAILECRRRTLAVRPEGGLSSRFSTSTQAFERLPNLIIEDPNQVVDVALSVGPRAEYRVVARGVVGRVRLGALAELRGVCGMVRVRLDGKDRRSWSARWTLIPPYVVESLETGRVVFASPHLINVSSAYGAVSPGRAGHFSLQVPLEHDRARALLGFASGESVPVSIPMPRSYVRLWRDILQRDEAPLNGSAIITERMVFEHACVEVRSDAPDRGVWLEDKSGASLVSGRTDRHGRALISLRDVLRCRYRSREGNLGVIVRSAGDPGSYRFQIAVPRMQHPSMGTANGRLVLKVILDERDLPERPALACFDILRPFDEPAIIDCSLTATGTQRYEASVDGARLPTSRSRWVVFLVDAAKLPARSMSGGVLAEIPLGAAVTPPRALSALDAGLWEKDEEKVVSALLHLVENPIDFSLWLQRFIVSSRARAAYGLTWFFLFDIIARRAPWVILAAAISLPSRDRYRWMDLYRAESEQFTWLGLSRASRQPLASALRKASMYDITALIAAAREVCRMPRAIELAVYQDILAGRPEASAILAALQSEFFGQERPIVLPRDWNRLALPMLDISQTASDDSLRGRRAAALVRLKYGVAQDMLGALPRGWVFASHPSLSQIAEQLIEEEAKKKKVPADGHARGVVEAELRAAEAAALLTAYRERGARITKDAWRAIATLEKSVPDLLDVWLLALMGS